MTRVLAIVLFVLFAGSSWFGVWRQDYETGRKLTSWTPVEVERTTQMVERQRGPKIPGVPASKVTEVVYRYTLGGRQITLPPRVDPPLEEIGPIFDEHAKAMREALAAGRPFPEMPSQFVDTVSGYANPAQPEELYFHHPRFQMLLPKLMPLVVLIVCVMGMMVGQPHTSPQVPRLTKKPPWRKLLQARRTHRAIVENMIVAATWGAMVYFVCANHFRLHQPPSTEARISASIFGSLTLIPVALVLFYLGVVFWFGQPDVYINTPFLVRGQEFTVRLRQAFRRGCHPRWLRLGLLCMKEYTRYRAGRTRHRAAPVFAEFAELAPQDTLEAGTAIKFQQKFRVPHEVDPSTAPEAWNTIGSIFAMQHYSWYIRVELKVSWLPSLKADFPVRVE